jgi:hypothetical protein
MKPRAFQELVGRVSGLGEESDFVTGAVVAELRSRGELLQNRAQAVANDARGRASGYRRVALAGDGGTSRGLGPSPDAALLSRALAYRLGPWVRKLREGGFGSRRVPFPEDLAGAARWIEEQSEVDGKEWQRLGVSTLEAEREIQRLADEAALVVRTEPRYLYYIRPDKEYRQMAGAFPGTFLWRLSRETESVAEMSGFPPEVLVGFVLSGLQPMISRVCITKTHGRRKVADGDIPYRSVTLEFNTADVSYEELRALYAEIREFFGATDRERLSWPEFDFISLVQSMGGPPQASPGKTRFWEDVLQRYNELPASRYSPLGSWRSARNKYVRLDGRVNLGSLESASLGSNAAAIEGRTHPDT